MADAADAVAMAATVDAADAADAADMPDILLYLLSKSLIHNVRDDVFYDDDPIYITPLSYF